MVQDDKFKGIYNNYLESSSKTVDEIYKKSDELEANKTSSITWRWNMKNR